MAEANFHGIKPIHLIVLPIAILAFMGGIYNALAASGMVVTQTYNCDFTNYLNCAGSLPVGCDNVPCGPQGVYSFFNPKSPFTKVFQGDLMSLFSFVQSAPNPSDVQPFADTGQTAYYSVACTYIGTGTHTDLGSYVGFQNIYIQGCTQVDTAKQPVAYGDSQIVPIQSPAGGSVYPAGALDPNTYASIAGQTYGQHLFSNSTFCSGPIFNPSGCFGPYFQEDETGSGSVGFWQQLFGGGSLDAVYFFGDLLQLPNYCTFSGGSYDCSHHLPTQAVETLLYASPATIGCQEHFGSGACDGGVTNQAGVTGTVYLLAQVESWNVYYCQAVVYGDGNFPARSAGQTVLIDQGFLSQSCVNFFGAFRTPNVGYSFGALTPIITFFIGLALLFLGLGLSFSVGGEVIGTGTVGGMGSNMQGTRLAQVFGVGLILYSFIFSEFGAWVNSATLPWGADLIVAFLVPVLFFGGLVWQTWAGGGAE